jgi:opacity protein-like surface antigen
MALRLRPCASMVSKRVADRLHRRSPDSRSGMRVRGGILLALLVVAWTAAPAQAQWEVSPYLGINLAGDVEFRRGGPGASVGYLGDRLGLEFDFERYNHFFKDKDIAKLVPNNCGVGPPGELCSDLNTDAVSFMGNVVAPIRIKGPKNWRPYATTGLGVIRAWVEDPSHQLVDTDQNNLAFNVGGGVMYSLNDRVSLRGDLRYFRTFVDENKREGGYHEDYGFLRTTVGVTFTFGR